MQFTSFPYTHNQRPRRYTTIMSKPRNDPPPSNPDKRNDPPTTSSGKRNDPPPRPADKPKR